MSIGMLQMEESNRRVAKQAARSGKPLNVYLPPKQASKLQELARARHVPMSHIVRFALDRLFDEMDGGQLDLPLGIGG
jgi:hypothetical protein